MEALETAYWRGATDLALLEINELTALHASARVRQRAMEIFLASAELGGASLVVDLLRVMPPVPRGYPGSTLVQPADTRMRTTTSAMMRSAATIRNASEASTEIAGKPLIRRRAK